MNALPFLRARNCAQAAGGGSATGQSRPSWRALVAVMEERCQQIVRYGHSPERDLARLRDDPRHAERIALIAADLARDAAESLQFGGPVQRRIARRRAARSAATLLALIDLLDNFEDTADVDNANSPGTCPHDT